MSRLLILFSAVSLLGNVYTKITIDKMGTCETDKQYKINYTVKLKTENDKQFIEESAFNTQVDMDNNIIVSAEIFMEQDSKWQSILTQKGPLCEIQEKFAGEFAEEMEKAAGQKGCPFPKGEYSLKNYELDYSKFAYKDFPEGRIQIRAAFNSKDTNEELGCILTEFTLSK